MILRRYVQKICKGGLLRSMECCNGFSSLARWAVANGLAPTAWDGGLGLARTFPMPCPTCSVRLVPAGPPHLSRFWPNISCLQREQEGVIRAPRQDAHPRLPDLPGGQRPPHLVPGEANRWGTMLTARSAKGLCCCSSPAQTTRTRLSMPRNRDSSLDYTSHRPSSKLESMQ